MIYYMRAIKVLFLGFGLLLVLPATGHTTPPSDCPQRLGVVSNSDISQKVLSVMRIVYQQLGCPLKIEYLPGRRGFVAFDAGDIDGELFRVADGAKKYKRTFVQSAVPLMEVSISLWGEPGSTLYSDDPIGHTLGVIWEENFLEKHQLPKSGHRDENDLIEHYNAGTFNRFISEDSNIRTAIEDGDFTQDRIPVQIEVLQLVPIYHYLAAEYAPFMQRLSDYLKRNTPFENAKLM